MRCWASSSAWLGVLLGALLVLSACNEVSSARGVEVSVLVREPDLVPASGAVLCEMDTPRCTTTNDSGQAKLVLPAGETAFTIEHDGFAPTLIPMLTRLGFNPGFAVLMWSDEFMARQAERMNVPYPIELGSINIDVGMPDVTFDLINANPQELWYVTEDGAVSTELEATSSFGAGGFAEVGRSEAEFDVEGAAERCVPDWAWATDTIDRFRVPVRPGFLTRAVIVCPVL